MGFERINLVTAVSRPENLVRIHRSIDRSLSRSSLRVRWILVVDHPEAIWPGIEMSLRSERIDVDKVVYSGPKCSYGILQKNLGMDTISDGYYHLLDDDNLVHPEFFPGIERAMRENPSARAFVVSQCRWDNAGSLVASPERMGYGQIDNTMFVVHRDLISGKRYDVEKSGHEDFHFFRELWELYREKFVFIQDVLSYYNYIRCWPVETSHEPVFQPGGVSPDFLRPVLPMARAVTPPQLQLSSLSSSPSDPQHPAVTTPSIYPPVTIVESRKPKMKVALYSSKRDRCGISTYTSHLADALATLGCEVQYFSSQPPYEQRFREILDWRPDVFHFQHETSIMPGGGEIARFSALLRERGARVFITLHTESLENVNIGRSAGPIIIHRPSQHAPDAHVLPMPCTNAPSLPERAAARRHFGIPDHAFLLSTVGFMIPWKDHPKVLELMAPWLRGRPEIHVQLIASAHFNENLQGYAHLCRQQILQVAAQAAIGDRVHHVDSYPSDLELINRLSMSDLGYVWCPFDTGSSSAAGAQFTAARCPLVSTDSSHYMTLGEGTVRAPKGNMAEFVATIQRTVDDGDLLRRLKEKQGEVYSARNYAETARKHLVIYNGGRV